MTPIVESPTSEYPSPSDEVPASTALVSKSQLNSTSGLLSSPRRDADAASIRSTNTNASPPNSSSSKKKEASKPWRRQPTSKPTGLCPTAATILTSSSTTYKSDWDLSFE
ncbi:GRAM domain-containing protein YSP2 [Lentinula edodes]|uniref:GRAM domain-containing protein YSP2 n=1 Tax=Lentinula edodes TaxID=5353 RepID=A0A1Q3EA01_LENED|nr:GRAM domain-containing protein YSP2 [Lentinula edodes]